MGATITASATAVESPVRATRLVLTPVVDERVWGFGLSRLAEPACR